MDQEKIDAYNAEQKRLADEAKEKADEERKAKELLDALTKSSLASQRLTIVTKAGIEASGTKVSKAIKDSSTATNAKLETLANEIKKIPDGVKIPAVPKFPDEVKVSNFPKFPDFPKIPDTVKINNLQDIKPWFDAMSEALSKIEFSPTINVAPTPVDVNVPEVNVQPIAEAMKEKEDEIDLDDFKAQDLTGDDTFQYIGFVAPNGYWYIIENDIEANSLRYKFGTKNYPANWKKYNGHSYSLINEAIREIQA